MQPSDLNEDLIKQIYEDLNKPMQSTYGKNWANFDYKEPGNLIQKFKKNLWQFSGAKTLAELEKINSHLVDKSGRIRPYHEFKDLVEKENINFNYNYLQAEYQTALRGSQMAHQWAKFQKNKDLFPNLEYRTAGDSRVRKEHEKLNKVVKHIDDPFWKTYYPPNGWRCRCTVVPTAAPADSRIVEDENVLPEFRGNVATDEEIFTSKGSFFKLLNKDHVAKRNAELMKYNAPEETAYKNNKNGKQVKVNLYADEMDVVKNVETGIVIADQLNYDVVVRPHLDTNLAKGIKNPEYYINGKISDRKEVTSYTGVASAVNSVKEQKATSIVFDLVSFPKWEVKDFCKILKGKINSYKKDWLEEIIVVNGNKAISFSPKELNEDYPKVYKLLESTKVK